jgi:uncharacterized protein YggT (Ycf19 family)
MTALDTLFNIFLLIFWIRIWGTEDRSYYFNPYLARLRQGTNQVFRFLEPVFFQASTKVVASVSLVLLLVFRAFLLTGDRWSLGMGRFYASVQDPGMPALLAFSFLSFAVFIVKLWAIAVIYLSFSSDNGQARTAIRVLTHPFSALKVEHRPVVLVLAASAVVFLLNIVADNFTAAFIGGGGMRIADLCTGQPIGCLLRLILVGISGILEIIGIIRTVVLVLIIGSLVSTFAGSAHIAYVSREWIDLFLGIFRRYPLRIGMFDLTPIVFFFVLGIAEGLLNSVIIRTFIAIS